MKRLRWTVLFFLAVLLAACGRATPGTSTLPPPGSSTTPVPSIETAMRTFLDAEMVKDYHSMYALLAKAARGNLAEADFAKRYQDALYKMNVTGMVYSIQSTYVTPTSGQVAFRITYHTALVGDLTRDILANLVLEDSQWRLQWDDGLILPELAGGKHLVTNYRLPARGDIYDRNGNAIVTQTDAVAIGLVAGQVSPDTQDSLFNLLWRLTGVRPEYISAVYQSYPSGQYVPIGEASAEIVNRSGLSGYSGVQLNDYTSRFYQDSGVAPQAVGYTQAIFPDEVDRYNQLGYSGGEMVGKTGVEKLAEQYLAGRDGATIFVANPDGSLGDAIASVDPKPADSVYLTIDKDLQEQAQQAMDGLPGAIVVLERDTGRILAMVSSPSYDPNTFDVANNPNSINLSNMLSTQGQPLLNRATQGQYPLGSVFKIVTMAAALNSGVFTPESTWDCAYDYTELVTDGGPTLYDWTWQHCQDAKAADPNAVCNTSGTRPSGLLTLPEGLMRSCDPWFYHIGYTLWKQNLGSAISDMAKAFGLGKPTGIGIDEEPGSIPAAPSDGTNATSIAIGQGGVLVTPLQVADFIAAVGNGGTLYQPQLIEKIKPVSGDPVAVFAPKAVGTLPIKTEDLLVIQQAMRTVANDPRGTAYNKLGTFAFPVAAKTGTAESGTSNPHAWFAGYSLAELPGKPDIAVVVVVNNQGEGATWALPIFKRVMEIYFYGKPQSIYSGFERGIGILAAPTETPTPTTSP